MQKQKKLNAARLILILFVVLIAYSNSFDGGFQFDDTRSIVDDHRVRDFFGFFDWRWFPATFSGTRPLTALSLAFNYAIGGFNPFGYHVLNLLIHLSVVSLIYFFTIKVLRSAAYAKPEALAVIISAIFGLSPVNTQAVSYIVQRAEAISSLFYIASLLIFIKSAELGFVRKSFFLYLAGLCLLFFGFGAKAIIITLPAAYILYDQCFVCPAIKRGEVKANLLGRIAVPAPFLILGVLYAVLRLEKLKSLEGNAGIGFNMENMKPATYLMTQFKVVLTYIRLILFPFNQSLDYDYPVSASFFEIDTCASFLILLFLFSLAIALIYCDRRQAVEKKKMKSPGAVVAFGILWFFLLLLPTSSIVPVVDVIYEHRVYLASWGVITALVVLADTFFASKACGKKIRLTLFVVLALVLIFFSALIYKRNEVWNNNVSLWSDVVKKSPLKARGYLNLGHGLIMEEGCNAAWPVLKQGLALVKENSTVKVDVLNNLAICAMESGRNDEALTYALRASFMAPGSANVKNTLGEIFFDQKNYKKASEYFMAAIKIRPTAQRYFNAALSFEGAGEAMKACEYWKKYLEIEYDPASVAEVRKHMEEQACL